MSDAEFVDEGLNSIDFNLLVQEDVKQLSKWGYQRHSPFEWLAFITEELGELSEAISEHCYRDGTYEAIIHEATQVATLALKVAVMAQDCYAQEIADDLQRG
ncbi:MAG: nucleoside triphosphate pyrophosphohydrolase family protein [Planctomycetota bacterium]